MHTCTVCMVLQKSILSLKGYMKDKSLKGKQPESEIKITEV